MVSVMIADWVLAEMYFGARLVLDVVGAGIVSVNRAVPAAFAVGDGAGAPGAGTVREPPPPPQALSSSSASANVGIRYRSMFRSPES